MHFGRVQDDRGLDLALPEPRPRTQGYLRLNHQGRGDLRLGAPIWNCPDWLGTVYPEGSKPSEYLRLYAEQSNCVEFNGSFYRLPEPRQVQSWLAQVGPDFRFCPKLPQDLSHQLHRGFDVELLQQTLGFCESLGPNCGLCFMQLPDWFAPEHQASLWKFLQQWSRHQALAVEFRHPAWFANQMLLDPVINELYRLKVATVITDSPGRRDVVHMALTYPKVMVRFLGCFPSSRDDQRIRDWTDRLGQWAELGMDELYFFIHQARNGAIPQTLDFAKRCLYERQSRLRA